MQRRDFIRIGGAMAVMPELLKGIPLRAGEAAIRHPKSQRMDLYLIWGDADATHDFRVTIEHELGSCCYSFDQNHTPGRHFAGSYYPGNHPQVTGLEADEKEGIPFECEWVPTRKRNIRRMASETMTPFTLNVGDTVTYVLSKGDTHTVKLLSTSAEVTKMGPDDVDHKTPRVFQYTFSAHFRIDDENITVKRLNPSNADTFPMPFYVKGMMFYLDAVQNIFEDAGGFMGEKDVKCGITCRPKRDARIVIQDAARTICPGKIYPWFAGAGRPHKVWICYHGRDSWMGTWTEGANEAHGGLDINMPSGTILNCPIDLDNQYFFQSTAKGANNNRWRGVRKFRDGTVWWIQAHHINMLLPDIIENTPMRAGTPYADTAGTYTGRYEHTHFCLRIFDGEEDFWLDPWLLMRASSI